MNTYTISANQFAQKHGVKLHILNYEYRKYFPEDKESRYVFTCRLTRGRKQYTFTFGQSIAAGGEEPNLYDVLTCLQKYDVGTFDDFCANFGYDTDSRTAERIYKNVCKEYKAVERLFSDVIDELQEIQ
jgi:hypothetical protein